MNPSCRSFSCAISALALFAGIASAVGPTSTLYIVNYGEFGAGTVTGLNLIQGLTQSSFPTGNSTDTCIAVAGGDVRTFGYSGTLAGSRFNLGGGPIAGGPYLNSMANSQFHDGTSDGSFNYSVDYVTGNIIEFDRSWGSPSVLFNATATLPGAGWITMDGTDGSFWLSQWGGPDRVEHRTHAGALISSFNSGIAFAAGLALDPVDGTLWTSDGASTLHQFSQGGTLLQSVAYAPGQWYGMEFATVPGPGTLGALGCAGVVALRRRRL